MELSKIKMPHISIQSRSKVVYLYIINTNCKINKEGMEH